MGFAKVFIVEAGLPRGSLRMILSCLLVAFLIFLAAYARRSQHFRKIDVVTFVVSWLMEAGIVILLFNIGARSLLLALLVSPLLIFYSTLCLLEQRYTRLMQRPLDAGIWRFARREPRNAWVLIRDNLGFAGAASWVVIFVSIILALHATGSPWAESWQWFVWLGVLSLAFTVWILRQRSEQWSPLVTIARAVFAPPESLGQFLKYQPLEIPKRQSITRRSLSTSEPSCNFLIFLTESLATQPLAATRESATRDFHRFLARHRERLVSFPHALTASTASDVSYPCTLTGLSPESTHEQFHRQPLLWDYAKAAGYTTHFYSAQSLSWGGFEQFFLQGSTLDTSCYRESLQAPLANDLGMDDRELLRYILYAIHREQWRAPFFTVINFNMLHSPCLVDHEDSRFDLSTAHGRYCNALGIFDLCVVEILDRFEENGVLDNTCVVFVSDHGESFDGKLRTDDFTLDTLRVPFQILLPEKLREKRLALLANQQNVVSNLDLCPTLLSLLNFSSGELNRLGIELTGCNLFQPIPDQRELVMSNVCQLREWPQRPFALTHDHRVLIRRTLPPRYELYDLSNSSPCDLWPTINEAERTQWHAAVSHHPLLLDILAAEEKK